MSILTRNTSQTPPQASATPGTELLSHLWGDADEVNLAYEALEPAVRSIFLPREAWDALVMPLRIEAGELVCATTQETYHAALKLTETAYDGPVRLVITGVRLLEQFIAEQYGYEGVDIDDAA
ncbi:MAG: hypothetical protein AAF288_05640 [Planctomycetota bacterium]